MREAAAAAICADAVDKYMAHIGTSARRALGYSAEQYLRRVANGRFHESRHNEHGYAVAVTRAAEEAEAEAEAGGAAKPAGGAGGGARERAGMVARCARVITMGRLMGCPGLGRLCGRPCGRKRNSKRR